MTTPKVAEIIRNGNLVGKRALDRQSTPPTTVAQTPSR
jgi:hypothetical protein